MKGIKGIEQNQTDLQALLFLTKKPKDFGFKSYIPFIPFIPVKSKLFNSTIKASIGV
jgi:hypothetical protein